MAGDNDYDLVSLFGDVGENLKAMLKATLENARKDRSLHPCVSLCYFLIFSSLAHVAMTVASHPVSCEYSEQRYNTANSFLLGYRKYRPHQHTHMMLRTPSLACFAFTVRA